MDDPLNIAVFGFGAILLLIAVLNGQFKIYGAEISGGTGLVGRLVAGLLGLVLILFGLDRGGFLDSPEAAQLQSAPTAAGAAPATEEPPAEASAETPAADATEAPSDAQATDDATSESADAEDAASATAAE